MSCVQCGTHWFHKTHEPEAPFPKWSLMALLHSPPSCQCFQSLQSSFSFRHEKVCKVIRRRAACQYLEKKKAGAWTAGLSVRTSGANQKGASRRDMVWIHMGHVTAA